MRKILFAVLLFFLAYQTVFAIDAVSDYQFQQEKYRKIQTEFISAKSQYQQFKTVASQKELEIQFKNLLLQKAKVLRAYFYALIQKLNQSQGLNSETKDKYTKKIQENIKSSEDFIKNLENLSDTSLTNLLTLSSSFDKNQENFQILSQEVISLLLIQKTEYLNKSYSDLSGKLKIYSQKNNVSNLSDLFSQAENIRKNVENNLTQARSLIPEYNKEKQRKIEEITEKISLLISQSQNQLLEGTNYQTIILNKFN